MLSLPTSILVADDGSTEADMALGTAVAGARATASTLSLVHVKSLEPIVAGTTVTPAQVDRLREQGEALVERRGSETSTQGVELDHAVVRLARRIEATVIRTAAELGTGLLVVGARGGTPGSRRALGDLSLRLARDAHCSVLVVRAQATEGAQRSGPEDQREEHR
ncbi:universal stress protein [Nocardiopsis nanhaiensis]